MTTGSQFDLIADGAADQSPLWAESLRPRTEWEREPVFSTLVPDGELVAGLETIYEGYLLHYGRSRVFAPVDADVALLLGDTLLAHGLVRIAATGNLRAVTDLAELLSLCAQARADALPGDGAAWAATAATLGRGGLEPARATLRESRDPGPLEALARATAGEEAVARALAAHAARVL